MSTRKASHEKKARKQNCITQNQKVFADAVVADPRFKICYLFPHAKQNLADKSVFGWYTAGLHEAAFPLIHVAGLPVDIREPFTSSQTVLRLRLLRRLSRVATPITIDALTKIHSELCSIYPFRVIYSTDESIALQVDELIQKGGWPTLHVSTIHGASRVLPHEFNTGRLIDYCKSVITYFASIPKWSEFVAVANSSLDMRDRQLHHRHELTAAQHNMTLPNERALAAFGLDCIAGTPLDSRIPIDQYLGRICESANAVSDLRNQMTAAINPEIIPYRYLLAVQSLYWGHYKNTQHKLSEADPEDRKLLKFIRRVSAGKETYVDQMEGEEISYCKHPLVLYTLRELAADAKSFTAVLALLTSETLTPVLRLEPRLNKIRGDLKQFASSARSASRYRRDWKMSQGAYKIGQKLRSLVASEYLELIDAKEPGCIEGLKLVSDLPLEMMTSGGIPLALRFDVSRTPVVPGNMLIGSAIKMPVVLDQSAFLKLLVIRSFAQDDPLRRILQISLEAIRFSNPKTHVDIKFIDVNDEDEFVDALNDYDGAVVIFDGHGSYNNEIGQGGLVIGGQIVDTWKLSERCEFPPIVIFSACDTQPIDGSHSSVATAAFSLGAHTVLGTILPVQGVNSGVFLGRLLLRMAEFIPLAVKNRPLFTWREVVSGMQRMMHVTEVMRLLKRNVSHYYPRTVNTNDVQFAANMAINNRDAGWHDIFLDALAKTFDRPLAVVRDDVEKWGAMSDALKHVQLGNPESVIIIDRKEQTAAA